MHLRRTSSQLGVCFLVDTDKQIQAIWTWQQGNNMSLFQVWLETEVVEGLIIHLSLLVFVDATLLLSASGPPSPWDWAPCLYLSCRVLERYLKLTLKFSHAFVHFLSHPLDIYCAFAYNLSSLWISLSSEEEKEKAFFFFLFLKSCQFLWSFWGGAVVATEIFLHSITSKNKG